MSPVALIAPSNLSHFRSCCTQGSVRPDGLGSLEAESKAENPFETEIRGGRAPPGAAVAYVLNPDPEP